MKMGTMTKIAVSVIDKEYKLASNLRDTRYFAIYQLKQEVYSLLGLREASLKEVCEIYEKGVCVLSSEQQMGYEVFQVIKDCNILLSPTASLLQKIKYPNLSVKKYNRYSSTSHKAIKDYLTRQKQFNHIKAVSSRFGKAISHQNEIITTFDEAI